MFNQNENFQTFFYDDLKKQHSKPVLLTMKKDKKPCQLEKLDALRRQNKNENPNNPTSVDTHHDTDIKEEIWIDKSKVWHSDNFNATLMQTEILRKVPVRKVPNILKNHSKLHSFAEVLSPEIDPASSDVLHTGNNENILFDCNATLNTFLAKQKFILDDEDYEGTSKPLNKRKQRYNLTNVRQELPNWNNPTDSVKPFNQNDEVSNNKLFTPELRSPIQKKQLKHKRKKNTKETSLLKSNNKSLLIAPSSPKISDFSKTMNFLPQSNPFSSPQNCEQDDIESSIDFSSNEIFNKFNYEFCNIGYANYFNEFAVDSNEMCDRVNEARDNGMCEEEYDINGNQINICEPKNQCNLTQRNKHDEINLRNVSPEIQGNWSRDITLLTNNELSHNRFVPNPCCDHSKNCLFHCNDSDVIPQHFLPNNRVDHPVEFPTTNDDFVIMDKVLTETASESCNVRKSDKDLCVNNIETSSTAVVMENEYDFHSLEQCEKNVSSTSVVEERHFDDLLEKAHSAMFDLESSSRYTSEYTESLFNLLDIKNDVEKEKLGDFSNAMQSECDGINTMVDMTSEFDFGVVTEGEFEKKVENGNCAAEAEISDGKNTNRGTFQCLLCPLTFSISRTLALHQAGAHGGTYIILCERCGRLFNRKYHFNRHFVHCGRLKEPFKCDMCVKQYRHRSSLVHHLKTVHHVQYAHKTSKTFTCDICSKVYSKFGAFENHLNRHKNSW